MPHETPAPYLSKNSAHRTGTMGPLPNSALKGKAKSLTKLPVDNFAFSFNLPLFLIF
jgi:hypothetical protein